MPDTSRALKSPATLRCLVVARQEALAKRVGRLGLLLSAFQGLTGHGLLLNASLSRPGEALVCTPEDALNMFLGTDLSYMIMEDVLVTKRESSPKW